jgi:hypothetical protein
MIPWYDFVLIGLGSLGAVAGFLYFVAWRLSKL